ncbi:hypothetical protein [Marinimicrobium sp. ABcell2]|uniref:hypothetical protein n=1 Tax=Marinimicrobium sp. ABcell2 TaxID=3069751 RepID=UPI0027B5F49F|nr:hypothetical protein [Marinimicrobium sp. ABcell2]MDQ2078527.1 hypothetical protein [Marinimicrobium sp. ABcell2]
MNKNAFADGMLINTALIVAGVVFLVWLSTLGSSDIATKMEFYGTSAGKFVSVVLLMVPFAVVFQKVTQGGLSGKRLAILIIGMVLVQLVIAAYMPLIVELFRGAGVDAGEVIIRAKD